MQELINAKIKELTENGKLDEIVTKRAISFINDMLDDVLRSYNDVSKAYKEKMTNSLLDNIKTMDFVSYSKTITDLMESELNNSVVQYGIAPVKEMIRNFTGALEKTDWKLSEIIEKYIEGVVESSSDESGEISFIFERSDYGTVYVAFSEDANKTRRYECEYRLMFDKDGTMYSPSTDKMHLHPVNEMGRLSGFDLFLFKLYATKCKVTLDQHSVNTEWSKYND